MTTDAPPKGATSEVQTAVEVILYIDKHHSAPSDYGDAGRLRYGIEALIEAIQDSLKTYQKERALFLNNNPLVMAALATYGTPEPAQEEDDRFTTGKNGKRIIKLWSIEDIYALPDPDYLIEPIFPSVGVSIIYGLSGTGKTFATLGIGLSVAHGKEWMGRYVQQGNVFYINSEGRSSLGKRIKAWHIENTPLKPSHRFRIIPWGLDLQEHLSTLLDTIEDMAEEQKPDLLIFDNFSMCANIDQNKQNEVAPILKILNDLAEKLQCHILILHHTTKEDNFNGSMAFRNHTDVMIELKKEDKADNHSPILFHSQKARDDEPFSDIRTELKQITLYVKENTLLPVTSCVVVPAETPSKGNGLHDVAQNILDLLGDMPRSYTDWSKEAIKVLGISKPTFDRYKKLLEGKGYIEKCKVEGVKYEQYRKKVGDTENLAGEGNAA